ncbi:putative inner membrane protein [Shigella flexneri 1235-66]|nr:putative inner membrane protein [Shigella flexneri 1235-66]
MVVPRTNGGVDKASEEEEKTDKQYDPDHATIKSVSFA